MTSLTPPDIQSEARNSQQTAGYDTACTVLYVRVNMNMAYSSRDVPVHPTELPLYRYVQTDTMAIEYIVQ